VTRWLRHAIIVSVPGPIDHGEHRATLDPNFVDARHHDKEPLIRAHASEILEFIGPFETWKPKLVPALPDLEQRAKEACWWLEVRDEKGIVSRGHPSRRIWPRRLTGVKVCVPSMRRVLERTLNVGRPDRWESLLDNLADRFRYDFKERLGAPTLANVEGHLDFWITQPLVLPRSSDWRSLQIIRQLGYSGQDLVWNYFWAKLWHSLDAALRCVVYFILLDEPDQAARFTPLFQLYLDGNFPLGFSASGDDLLVLVA
jgi:hypothetical protein